MLSAKELAIVLSYPRFSRRFRLPMCITLDEQRQLVVIPHDRWANISYFSQLSLGTYIMLHGAYRLVVGYRSGAFNLELQLLYLTVFFTELMSISVHIGFALWRRDLTDLHNKLVHMNTLWRPASSVSAGVVISRREKILNYLYFGWKYMTFGSALPSFAAIEFLYIVTTFGYSSGGDGDAPGGWVAPSPWVWAWASLHALIIFVYVTCCYMIGGHLQMTMFLFSTLVTDTLNRGDFDLLLYRALSVVTTHFNQTYSFSTVPPVKYVLSVAVMGCLVGAIRLPATGAADSVALSVGLLVLGLYFLGMLAAGTAVSSVIWAKASVYVWNWRHRRYETKTRNYSPQPGSSSSDASGAAVYPNRKYNQLVAASLAPIRFGVAGMYYMEREAKMTFLDFLLHGTLTMLIAFK